MWIFLPIGFFSVVQDRENKARLMIRARDPADLDRLRQTCEISETVETEDADYRWRAFVSRRDWSDYMSDEAFMIDYENFKNAVAKVDPERAHEYLGVWAIMKRVQDRLCKPPRSARREWAAQELAAFWPELT